MHARSPSHRIRITCRHLQIALSLLWLLDGALQLQPFMLGTGFARQVDVDGDCERREVAGRVTFER
jgi:hypothetical protein